MNNHLLVVSAVRGAVVLGAALVAYVAMARVSAAARRALLVLALAASIVVPVAAAFAPSWRVEAPAAFAGIVAFAHESSREGAAENDPSADTASSSPSSTFSHLYTTPNSAISFDRATALLAVWLLGVAALTVRAAASQLCARRLARSSDPIDAATCSAALSWALRESEDAADLRLCDAVDSPAVTGLLRSTILLPRDAERWSIDRLRVVLLHERAHVRRRDALAQLVADVSCALHWFNPLAWTAASRLRIERELAADDAVLESGVRASSYAEELLATAGHSLSGALAMAERTTLGARVVAILAAGRPRDPLTVRGTSLLVAGSVAVAGAAACASPTATTAPHVAVADSSSPSATLAPAAAPSMREGGASIDPAMQAAADDTLAAIAKEWSAESAVVLVLDVASGEILADSGRVGDHPFDFARSRAITPGSTLKPITIAAALENRAITSSELFDCGPKARAYGSRELHDASVNGKLDAAHLLAVSSNIGTSRIFDALGGEALGSWLTRFHFADAPKLEGATSGAFPHTITTGTLDGASVAIGEAMTATPVQMAAAYATLASDGMYHAPTTDRAASPAERVVSSSTASQVMAMLETAVVDPTATGKRARVDGIHVAGKTGTASFIGSDGHEHSYASFIGIADLRARRVVALVGVETLRTDVSGGEAAAPAFARLVTRIR